MLKGRIFILLLVPAIHTELHRKFSSPFPTFPRLPLNPDSSAFLPILVSPRTCVVFQCTLWFFERSDILTTQLQRGNLANARLKGLQTDLGLDDTQYATALSVLFAGYIFVRPRLYSSINPLS